MIFLLFTGTSALILYHFNIQSSQKYSAVMKNNESRFVRCYLLRFQLTASYVELLSLDLLISRPGHAASLALISTNVVTGRGFAQFSCIWLRHIYQTCLLCLFITPLNYQWKECRLFCGKVSPLLNWGMIHYFWSILKTSNKCEL